MMCSGKWAPPASSMLQRRSARQAEAREKFFGTVTGGSYHVTTQGALSLWPN